MPFDKLLAMLSRRKTEALKQGGEEKVLIQHRKGRLTARERIDSLLDRDSFFEFGMLACSDMPGMQEKTPADGLITGYGRGLSKKWSGMAIPIPWLRDIIYRTSSIPGKPEII